MRTVREISFVIVIGVLLFGVNKQAEASWSQAAIGGGVCLVSGFVGEYFREEEAATNKQLENIQFALDKAREKLQKMGIDVTEESINGAYTLLLGQIRDLEKQALKKRVGKYSFFTISALGALYGIVNIFTALAEEVGDGDTPFTLSKEDLQKVNEIFVVNDANKDKDVVQATAGVQNVNNGIPQSISSGNSGGNGEVVKQGNTVQDKKGELPRYVEVVITEEKSVCSTANNQDQLQPNAPTTGISSTDNTSPGVSQTSQIQEQPSQENKQDGTEQK
jgi:hypothetical protein